MIKKDDLSVIPGYINVSTHNHPCNWLAFKLEFAIQIEFQNLEDRYEHQ